MVDTLNHPDLPLSPTRWRCLPAPETLMRIRKAKLLPRDEVGWISRNRLDSGRCLALFLDIPFYRTQNAPNPVTPPRGRNLEVYPSCATISGAAILTIPTPGLRHSAKSKQKSNLTFSANQE